MALTTAQIQTLLSGGNTLSGLTQAVYDLSQRPTGTDQASALLGFTGALTAFLDNPKTPFLQALGAGVGINASALGVTVNAVQLKSAYSSFQQAMRTNDIAAKRAAMMNLVDKAVGLYAAVGGTLAAIPVPAVKQVGLVIWAGGTAAQNVLNGNVSKILNIVGTKISETIARDVGGARATVNQYDIGAGELVTVQFTDRYGIKYGEYGAVTGETAETLPIDSTIVHTHSRSTGIETLQQYGPRISSTSFSISSAQFSAGTAYANHSLNTAFTGNTVDYAQSLLSSIGQSNFSLQNYISPNSLSYQYSDLVEWFSHDTSYYQESDISDLDADMKYYKMSKIGHLIGMGQFDTEIGNRVASGIASPIVIDLNGDGIHTLDIDSVAVSYDVTGDDVKERTGWLSAGDGFLTMDSNNNGIVDGVNEMFGGLRRGEGYAELTELDSDKDGAITSRDAAYSNLKIWQDKNSNGLTDSGELYSLRQAGISRLGLDYESQEIYDNRNLVGEVSGATVNGAILEMADVYFKYRETGGFIARSAARSQASANTPASSAGETAHAASGILRTGFSTPDTLPLIDAMAQFTAGAPETGGGVHSTMRHVLTEMHWAVSA